MTDLMTRFGDFANGVALRDMTALATHSGKVFWVSSTAGGDGNEGSFDRPLATIDAAINKCSANRGDIIMVKAGHAETLTAASAITCDIAGVSIIGCGNGADRPELTFSSSTGASVVISAANVTIQNIIGVAGVDGLTNPFHVSGSDCTLDIEWRDDSSTVEAARAVLTTAAANRFKCRLRYYGQTGGNACVNAVRLVGCDEGWLDIDFYGVASTSIVEFLTTACTGVRIVGNFYNSGTTDGSKNVVDTATSSTWWANIFDGAAGAPYTGGSGSSLAQDDVSAISAALYGSAGITTFPSAAAPANGVSMAEVLRSVYDAVAADSSATTTVHSQLGRRVTKVATLASDPDDLFTVTGKCLVTLMVGECTSVVATTTSLSLNTSTNSIVIAASTDVVGDAAGALYIVTGDPDDGLNGQASGADTNVDVARSRSGGIAPFMVNDDKIFMNLDGAGTGLIQWDLYYIPLEASASIASSA